MICGYSVLEDFSRRQKQKDSNSKIAKYVNQKQDEIIYIKCETGA